MPVKIKQTGQRLGLSDTLVLIVQNLLYLHEVEQKEKHNQLDIYKHASFITVNFRDPTYSAEEGGYHPVEIGLKRTKQGKRQGEWQADYITDFSYYGAYFPELAKEIDVNFEPQTISFEGMGMLEAPDDLELYNTFESNFIEYFKMDVFNISVTITD